MVKRYGVDTMPGSEAYASAPYMAEEMDGEWVSFDDYESLQTKLNQVFEIVGRADRGEMPYEDITDQIVALTRDWATQEALSE